MTQVTVIMPVYNTENEIERAIKSVLEQEQIELCLYIVDDGSTDASSYIAQHYCRKDSRVTYIRKSNQGQGIARNIGIRLASSEYLYFLDSDDYLGRNALQLLYESCTKYKLDICSPEVPHHYFKKPLELVGCIPCKSQFIRADLVYKNKILQPDISSGQDGVFSNLVLTSCTRIGCNKRAILNYTTNRKGSTFSRHLKRHDLVKKIIFSHLDYISGFYEANALWEGNYLRFLSFICLETLPNRVKPHLPKISDSDLREILQTLSTYTQKCLRYLNQGYAQILPIAVKRLAQYTDLKVANHHDYAQDLCRIDSLCWNSLDDFLPSKNFEMDGVYICKYSDQRFSPNMVTSNLPEPMSPDRLINSKDEAGALVKDEIRHLNLKLDLAINYINNSLVQINSGLSSFEARVSSSEQLDPESNIIVSLTSLPHRLSSVHLSIESIYSQTMRPREIHLWIPSTIKEGQLPRRIQSLRERGLVCHFEEDIGPHMKLMYAKQLFPDNPILTIDDDVLYPSSLIATMSHALERHNDSIICNWARRLAFNQFGEVMGVRDGILLTPPLLESEIEQAVATEYKPSYFPFPYGTSGVLYPPMSLHSKSGDTDLFQSLCPHEDDIWFKVMSLLNKTTVVTTRLGINPVHHCVLGSQVQALRHINHGAPANLKQMRATFNYFEIDESYINNIEAELIRNHQRE